MQVLVQLEHRAGAGEPCQLLDQDLERALLLALGAEVGGREALLARNAEQRREQKDGLVQLIGRLAEQRLELGELRLPRVVRGKTGGPLELGDDRMERAVGVVGRAEVA
ncbi:MAG TPA: hypothetical protein VLE23_09645, partial [Geminicoccaceae bacterium]|nr:hypothetical protein [Geminicoccaceae bacterium]